MSSSKLQIADPVRFAETIFGVKLWYAAKRSALPSRITGGWRAKVLSRSGKTFMPRPGSLVVLRTLRGRPGGRDRARAGY